MYHFFQLLTAEQSKILAVSLLAHHFHILKMFQIFTYASAHYIFPLCAPLIVSTYEYTLYLSIGYGQTEQDSITLFIGTPFPHAQNMLNLCLCECALYLSVECTLNRDQVLVCIIFCQLLTAEQNKILAVSLWAYPFYLNKKIKSLPMCVCIISFC